MTKVLTGHMHTKYGADIQMQLDAIESDGYEITSTSISMSPDWGTWTIIVVYK